MNAARIIVLILGIAILLINAALVITTLIVPRSASGLASLPMRVVRATFRRISLLARGYPQVGQLAQDAAGGYGGGHYGVLQACPRRASIWSDAAGPQVPAA